MLPQEQTAIKFPAFSTDLDGMFAYRSARYRRSFLRLDLKSPYSMGLDGGRTRDRTLDLSRVKGTLSLVSPSARPKNHKKTAAYVAYDFVVSYAMCPIVIASGTRLGPGCDRRAIGQRELGRFVLLRIA